MPAALPADWTAIAVMAAQGVTLQAISDSTGIALGTLQARCAREGWKRKPEPASLAPAVASGQMQARATKGLDIARDTLERRRESGKLSMSRYAQRALANAATLPRSKLLSAAQDVKAVAGVFATAFPEPKDSGATGATITLNVGFLLDCQAPGGPEGEIRDVEAEVVPGEAGEAPVGVE